MGSGGTADSGSAPTHAQLDGGGIKLSQESNERQEDALILQLVRVNTTIHASTSVGSTVRLNGKRVHVPEGLLGYLSTEDAHTAQDRRLTGGVVLDLPARPSATIKLNR